MRQTHFVWRFVVEEHFGFPQVDRLHGLRMRAKEKDAVGRESASVEKRMGGTDRAIQ